MPRSARAVLVALVSVSVVGLAGLGSGRSPAPSDQWTTLIETGDALAATGGTRAVASVGPALLTARTAYLLAFHHAQDALDVPRMLAVAVRLERLGEDRLAAHVRRAARATARSDTAREAAP